MALDPREGQGYPRTSGQMSRGLALTLATFGVVALVAPLVSIGWIASGAFGDTPPATGEPFFVVWAALWIFGSVAMMVGIAALSGAGAREIFRRGHVPGSRLGLTSVAALAVGTVVLLLAMAYFFPGSGGCVNGGAVAPTPRESVASCASEMMVTTPFGLLFFYNFVVISLGLWVVAVIVAVIAVARAARSTARSGEVVLLPPA
ncbi:MAG: hypothetical protein L3K03_01920 [Thermoplasmata archaeon]|nr:hypothetical protein [Thermoplasmata archaeon]